MTNIVVVGCGVIGAAIAYELSRVPGLAVTVVDRHPPVQGATAAALGVLMAVISQKLKGAALRRRLLSLQRYETLIPELEADTGLRIPYNRQGILKRCESDRERVQWQHLIAARAAQGWQLELLEPEQVHAQYSQLDRSHWTAALYSPQDRQVDPVALTQALVASAQKRGVRFEFGVRVLGVEATPTKAATLKVEVGEAGCNTPTPLAADWLVLSAGLGSTQLAASLGRSLPLQPVLGQAMHLRLASAWPTPQPVITTDDVHLVPLSPQECWVGATVEFPQDEAVATPDPNALNGMLSRAIAFCPELASATILKTWSGLRPRPVGRPAPMIEPLPGYANILVATGHYRNGILLAPATALEIRDLITHRTP
ncbi:FAD-dependent oxidoreductase [Neosynechococcus sphagnicola sy1]|uniref:FAD-dependent oxidoreductase n=1 Tax=Neosynechococcus sphagnicola sy1 TaxID=1497020 RepID=A0A098TMW2_9CYAN|nr:FAD-dependent oxidoreductase [Neosynechococcus sphagnicola]KGF73581.1 FAD-dependent oxidoreductase [Neosynechococcus sphagnicola sy1]